jgi:hypothetical protein
MITCYHIFFLKTSHTRVDHVAVDFLCLQSYSVDQNEICCVKMSHISSGIPVHLSVWRLTCSYKVETDCTLLEIFSDFMLNISIGISISYVKRILQYLYIFNWAIRNIKDEIPVAFLTVHARLYRYLNRGILPK